MQMTGIGARVYRKVMVRIVAVLTVLIVLSSIDRVNISFAALRMNPGIGLSPTAYGLGAGLFFVGYLLCQLPSVALLRRWGIRRWILLSVGGWGLVSIAMAAISVPWHFFVLRILLGALESGFAPGAVWFISRWLPQAYRSRSIALTLLAVPVSVVAGGPLCGWLVGLDWGGLPGWRLMFLVEGGATVLLGLFASTWLSNSPEHANWLTTDERRWIADSLAAAAPPVAPRSGIAWRDPVLWLCAYLWLALVTGANALIFWLPSVIAASGVRTPLLIGVLTAVPWLAIGLGMALNARHSDRSGERFRHVAFGASLAAAGLALASASGGGAPALVVLVVGCLGLGGAQSVFWAIPTRYLANDRPGNIAIINLCGNASSAVAPALIGWTIQRSGSSAIPVYALAGLLLIGALATGAIARTIAKHKDR
jgi:ACS family tartrate transporter-like MFS transporter